MKNILLIFLLALIFAGCSTVTVNTEGELSSTPTAKKGTYAWLQKSEAAEDIRINNPEIDGMVRRSVDKYLASSGYVKVEPDQADYLISWFGSIVEEVKEISLSSYYRRSGYAGLTGMMPDDVQDGKVKKVFARGTLIIDVADRETKGVVWRGSATNTIQDKMSTSRKAQYIDASVKKILSELPQR